MGIRLANKSKVIDATTAAVDAFTGAKANTMGLVRRPKVLDKKTAIHIQNTRSRQTYRVGFHKFFVKLLWLADAPAREPERFFVIQPSALKFGHRIEKMRFQFAPVVGRKVQLPSQFLPPIFNSGV